jgi:hypothetical protein
MKANETQVIEAPCDNPLELETMTEDVERVRKTLYKRDGE